MDNPQFNEYIERNNNVKKKKIVLNIMDTIPTLRQAPETTANERNQLFDAQTDEIDYIRNITVGITKRFSRCFPLDSSPVGYTFRL